jgi:hypothetical protein
MDEIVLHVRAFLQRVTVQDEFQNAGKAQLAANPGKKFLDLNFRRAAFAGDFLGCESLGKKVANLFLHDIQGFPGVAREGGRRATTIRAAPD